MPQSAYDIVSGILECYKGEEHCFVDALLIDDRNKRLEAGLKCLVGKDVCIEKVKKKSKSPSRETQQLIRKLKKHMNRAPSRGSSAASRRRA